ncbi:hypothetical protein [Alkalicoccobacillus gibsonii]|uniref:hypothetical protein n=1 Tax=Alkalicoccobacillus gibsonii TaxID=79881 RepID=UPI003512665C
MKISKDSKRRFIAIMGPAILVNLLFMLTLPNDVRRWVVTVTYIIAMIVFLIWSIMSIRKKQTKESETRRD